MKETLIAMGHLRLCVIFLVCIVLNITGSLSDDLQKVIGGKDTYPGEFPHMVAFKRNGGSFFCGGALITNKHVLTAGHCVWNNGKPDRNSFYVITGSISLYDDREIHKVSKITIPRSYIHVPLINDIAIVELTKPVTQNKYQKPIATATMDPPIGATITLTGWGGIYHNGPVHGILQKANFILLKNEDCSRRVENVIHDSQLCAFRGEGIGACMGDSGGPLLYNNTIIGIASWAIPCARGYPDGFTRVTKFNDFIDSVIKSSSTRSASLQLTELD